MKASVLLVGLIIAVVLLSGCTNINQLKDLRERDPAHVARFDIDSMYSLKDSKSPQVAHASLSKASFFAGDTISKNSLVFYHEVPKSQICLGISNNVKDSFIANKESIVYTKQNPESFCISVACVKANDLENYIDSNLSSWQINEIFCDNSFNKSSSEYACFLGVTAECK